MNGVNSASTQRSAAAQTFDAFSHPAFRRLWPAALLWYSARAMQLTTIAWLMLELTDSPSQVALAGALQMIPMFAFGLILGSFADRIEKRLLIRVAHFTNLLVSSTILVMVLSDRLQPWTILVCMPLIGTAWTLDFSTRRPYLSEIFAPDRLANAVSLDVVALRAGRMLGPLLGGILIAAFGYRGTFTVVTILYLAGVLLLMGLREHGAARVAPRPSNVGEQLVEAVRAVSVNRAIQAYLLVTLVMNLLGFPHEQLVSVIARDVLGVGSTLYGVLAAATGVGSLAGSLYIASRNVQRKGTLFTLGATLMMAALLPFALSSFYPLSVILLLLSGLGVSGFNTMQFTIVMQAVPPQMRGRSMGAMTLAIGAMPVGIMLIGVAAERLGPQVALLFTSGSGLLAMIMLLRFFPELRDQGV